MRIEKRYFIPEERSEREREREREGGTFQNGSRSSDGQPEASMLNLRECTRVTAVRRETNSESCISGEERNYLNK